MHRLFQEAVNKFWLIITKDQYNTIPKQQLIQV